MAETGSVACTDESNANLAIGLASMHIIWLRLLTRTLGRPALFRAEVRPLAWACAHLGH